jgi:hypothetical protein
MSLRERKQAHLEEEKKEDAMSPPPATDRHEISSTKSTNAKLDFSSPTQDFPTPTTSGSSWSDPMPSTSPSTEQLQQEQEHKTSSRSSSRLVQVTGTLFRTLLLDLPLLLVFALYLSTVLLSQIHELYLAPQMELMRWTPERAEAETTYYHRVCTKEDMTATDASELFMQPEMTVDDRVHHMMTHGVSVYPNLLSPETAATVRDYIIQQNLVEEAFDVIENEHRYSFGIRVDQHPSIGLALREILRNPFLTEALEEIVGKNPGIIEFTAITSTKGATTQRYHQDVVPEGSAAKYARTFAPSYSLFIPLQNTTAAMGATDICPGSHMCADGALAYCDDTGFQVSGRDDNWPAGAGALLNQQLSHRGMAFTDEHASERVLFILTFSPRPRFGPNALETRIPSTGGSYSLHYSQWGHTLADFQKSEQRMRQPWKMLHNLGLYKSAAQQWGWDYVSATTMRAVNEEGGYSRYDLDSFLEKGGFQFLPKYLHGVVSDEVESGTAWFDFALDTFKRCESALQTAHLIGLGVYVLGVLAINGILWAFGKRKGSQLTIVKSLGRLFVLHCLLSGLALLSFRRVSQTSWAKNISTGKLYQHSKQPREDGLLLPGTLPLDQDILVLDDYQSDSLGSYTKVLEVSHPGNKAWNEMVSHHSLGYNRLPSRLQELLCTHIALWVRQAQRRVLTKNVDDDWAELTGEMAERFYHKALLQRSDPFVRKAVTQIDFLLSETKYGKWRDTSMHRGVIPSFLRKLQDKILRLPWSHISKRSNVVGPDGIHIPRKMQGLPQPLVLPPSLLSSIPNGPRLLTNRRRMLPVKPATNEPYVGAWFQGGDIVEAKYQGNPRESLNIALHNS